MRRQRKTHVVKIGDCAYTSQESMARAKESANEAITAAFTDVHTYAPYVFEHRGSIGIMWREPFGFTYRILWKDQEPVHCRIRGFDSSFKANETAVRDTMLNHLAQAGWTEADGTEAPEFIADRASFESWARFQLDYLSNKDKAAQ